jgi:hypothetical protein
MITLEVSERNDLLDVVKTFATGKLSVKQSDSLCSVLAIVSRDVKNSAHRADTIDEKLTDSKS